MNKQEFSQLLGSPTKIKKVNIMPVDGRATEPDHKIALLGGNNSGKIDLRMPKVKQTERDELFTPHHAESMLIEETDSKRGGFSSARLTQKSRDYESESTYETNRSIAQEYYHGNRSAEQTRISLMNSSESVVQTNFKLIKRFMGSDDKGSPKYTLEMRPVSPKKAARPVYLQRNSGFY
jgi:hypothetical protein